MARVETGRIVTEPYASRTHCANRHLWTPETTRWRSRGYRGKHTVPVERDCLVCKAVSEGRRRAARAADRRYL